MRGRVGAVGAAMLVGLAIVLGWSLRPSPAGPPTDQVAPAPTIVAAPQAPVSARWSAAGALFDGTPEDMGSHYCSASVIDTPAEDVVLTAAHCISDGDGSPVRTGMLFVPGYVDGAAPFGAWTVTAAVVDPRWEATGDPDLDVAFLTVERADSVPVETLTGGFRLVIDPGSDDEVEAIGYPWFAETPVIRTGSTVRLSEHQLELDAPGLFDGTSGGPWVRDGDEVVGVTGGHEQGGTTPDVSYASYLGDAAADLLARITRGSQG